MSRERYKPFWGILIFLMLLSHLGEYGCEWAYECNSPPFRNDHKVVPRHSHCFPHYFRKQAQAILIDGKVFVVTVRHL